MRLLIMSLLAAISIEQDTVTSSWPTPVPNSETTNFKNLPGKPNSVEAVCDAISKFHEWPRTAAEEAVRLEREFEKLFDGLLGLEKKLERYGQALGKADVTWDNVTSRVPPHLAAIYLNGEEEKKPATDDEINKLFFKDAILLAQIARRLGFGALSLDADPKNNPLI